MSNEAFLKIPCARFWTRKEGFPGKLTFKPMFRPAYANIYGSSRGTAVEVGGPETIFMAKVH